MTTTYDSHVRAASNAETTSDAHAIRCALLAVAEAVRENTEAIRASTNEGLALAYDQGAKDAVGAPIDPNPYRN